MGTGKFKSAKGNTQGNDSLSSNDKPKKGNKMDGDGIDYDSYNTDDNSHNSESRSGSGDGGQNINRVSVNDGTNDGKNVKKTYYQGEKHCR